MPAAPVAANALPTSSLPLQGLKKRADFLKVGQAPKKISTKTIVLLAAANELSMTRVGYTVTKKTSKLAVERNKIKRRLRAAVRETFNELALPGHDYVVIGKIGALTVDYKDLSQDFRYALKKIAA